MGHQHLGKLPATRQWVAVIDMIAHGIDVAAIASATSDAAAASLQAYANDRTVQRALYLLAQIPLAARKREDSFQAALGRLGLNVETPDLFHIAAACLENLDRLTLRHRSDFGEIVALSAVESLQAVTRRSLDDLFGATSDVEHRDRTQEILSGLATVKQFGLLAEDFFGRVLRRHLEYYLSRELPLHVGMAKRFSSLREHEEFVEALHLHCRESSRIVSRFAGEWFSKANFEGGITQKKAGGFVFVAMGKLRDELRLRNEVDA
ncbi:hypothetical protein [Bauldia litoralis]|uniref:Uncharacterized protein n=1 Tax=Bauldia litoralis TaxID=665467 RepID=A0A1G6EMB3_9HYPH|nr:hypothetical protein [Bauldia litoralis]SDB58599.1 hypothetical protein SAMN02982931_04705 [Bauldia litoralis]